MRRLLLGTLLAVLCVLTACSNDDRPTSDPAPPHEPGDPGSATTEEAVPLPDGTELRYVLHAPPGAAEASDLPLVLVFHGSPGTPQSIAEDTHFDRLADREGFLVAYPDNYSGSHEIPVLLDHLAETWSIDERRIYAAGFSRGASAVYDVARGVSDRIAAFAPVSGISDSGFELGRVPSLITFQGTADDLAPGFAPVNRQWATAAGCARPRTATVRVETRTAQRSAARCAQGAEHVVYTVERMGHEWPRQATRLVWDFFAAHPLPR